jgi:hypothetical protein
MKENIAIFGLIIPSDVAEADPKINVKIQNIVITYEVIEIEDNL